MDAEGAEMAKELTVILDESNKKYETKEALTDFNFRVKKVSTKSFSEANKYLQKLKDIKKNYKKPETTNAWVIGKGIENLWSFMTVFGGKMLYWISSKDGYFSIGKFKTPILIKQYNNQQKVWDFSHKYEPKRKIHFGI